MHRSLSARLMDHLVRYGRWPTPAQSWARLFNAAVLARIREPEGAGMSQMELATLTLKEWLSTVGGEEDLAPRRAFFPMTGEYSPMIKPALAAIKKAIGAWEKNEAESLLNFLQILQIDADREMLRGVIDTGEGAEAMREGGPAAPASLEDLRKDISEMSRSLLARDVLELLKTPQDILLLSFLRVNILEAEHFLRTSQGPRAATLREQALQAVVFDLLEALQVSGIGEAKSDRIVQLLRDASRMQAQLPDALEALAQELRALRPGDNLRAAIGFDRIVRDPQPFRTALLFIRNGNPRFMTACPWIRAGETSVVDKALRQHAYKLHFVQVAGKDGRLKRFEAACLRGDRQAEVICRLHDLYLAYCDEEGMAPKAYGLRLIQIDGEVVLKDLSSAR